MELFLTLISGICWCIVYEECIRLSNAFLGSGNEHHLGRYLCRH